MCVCDGDLCDVGTCEGDGCVAWSGGGRFGRLVTWSWMGGRVGGKYALEGMGVRVVAWVVGGRW